MSMSILVVAAHPDDEILGAGGAAATLARSGASVRSCILSGEVDARRNRPETDKLRADTVAANATVGMPAPIVGSFPNIAFNTVPHLELVQFIENAIMTTGATTIITHHPGDLNDDHWHASRACQAAARLFQRRPGVPPLEALYYMEIPSSTDWAFPGTASSFRPDSFVELGRDMLDLKLKALHQYEGVMRPFPHPRSDRVIEGLAALRGGQAGMDYAEAFQTAFRALTPRNGRL